jgi:hypothetical protein
MKTVVLTATFGLAAAATLAAPAAHAATGYDPVSVKTMTSIVSDEARAPVGLGKALMANSGYVIKKAPGGVVRWNADGSPQTLPDDAGYSEDEGSPLVKTDQSADVIGKRHGEMGFASSHVLHGSDKGYVSLNVYRPAGHAVVVSGGAVKPAQLDALEAWATTDAANQASDTYAKAAMK